MKRFAIWIAPCLLTFFAAPYGAAQTLDELKAQWRAVNSAPSAEAFDQLLPRLLAYRAREGGRNWELNYMLGTSYCHVPGKEGIGKVAIYRTLGSYGLPDVARLAAEKALNDCRSESLAVPDISITVVPISGQLGATVHGKGGYEIDTKAGSTTRKIELSPMAVADLRKFLFMPDQASVAVSAAIERTKDKRVRGGYGDGFVVTTSEDLPPAETASCLVPYRDALKRQFGMAVPGALITTYVVKPEKLPEYAAILHGVKLPLGVVAYSVYEDLSIVGVSSYAECGSLAHELVHLLIRQNFGDSPAWLEEGLASEVAVAAAEPGEKLFHFNRSWRDATLAQHMGDRPKVSELVRAGWASYYTSEVSDLNRVTALHAMAAAFIRFLDAKGKLVPIYTSVRDALSSPYPLTDVAILERSFGRSVEQIDSDFVQWFRGTLRDQ